MFTATWQIDGVVTELRELKSTKNPDSKWRGYIAKVATLGVTLEVGLDEEHYKALKVGQPYQVVGRFETFAGSAKLVGTSVKPLGSKVAA